jgi:hypothetical protein
MIKQSISLSSFTNTNTNSIFDDDNNIDDIQLNKKTSINDVVTIKSSEGKCIKKAFL